MDEKNILRIRAKNIRKNLSINYISDNLCNLIRVNALYLNANNIMIFYPTKYEINLLNLLNDNKNFYFPKVCDKNMLICPYSQNTKFIKSTYGIMEPCTNPVSMNNLDLVILPALMADHNGYRLGYGGGFYDRFLENKPSHLKTILPIAKELVIDNLPHNEFDVKVDEIIFV